MASSVWAMPEEQWIDDSANEKDVELLTQHATIQSSVDEGNFRLDIWKKWKLKNGGVKLKIRTLPGRTRIVFLGTDEQWHKIPWTFWSRIFQAIGHPVERILFYADPCIRSDPPLDLPITPKVINGGYTYLGNQEIIVVYRFEEATRVLLHELLHTAGFDSEKDVEFLEAHTEAWTELFLCGLLSRGYDRKFKALWATQVKWMTEQAETLKLERSVNTPADYAWRYMLGKKQVLEEGGFLRSFKGSDGLVTNSLRFTTPEWDQYMF